MKLNILIFTFIVLIPTAAYTQNNTQPSVLLPAVTGMQVNSYHGNLYLERRDVFIPGRGLDIDFTFYYGNFSDTTDYGYGRGWTHSYHMHYTQQADTFKIKRGDGRQEVYIKSGGLYLPMAGIFNVLTEYEPGKFRLRTKTGMLYFFDDAAHRKLTKIQDRNGNTLTLNWSGTQLSALTDASGRQITFSWSNGHLTGITDALDTPVRSWTYVYQDGQLMSVTNPLGGQHLYVYNEQRNLIRTTDENSNETIVDYYPNGAVKTVATCLTRHDFSYLTDQGKSVVTEIVGEGTQTTTYEFDAQGRNIARKGNCCGFETYFQYDNSNNITRSTDGNGNASNFTFGPNGNTTAVADAEGCIMQMTYEPVFNQTTSIRDKNGNISTFTYDNKGNLTAVARPLGVSESYTYDAYGNQTGHTDARGNTTTYEYNSHGYMVKINHPVGNYTTLYTYDNRGNRRSHTDGNGHTTQYRYDALNRLTEMEDALGHITLYEYDARGNKTKETNALGHVTEYKYDPLDRLIEIKAPLNTVTKYTYDSRGNRLSETDTRGSVTVYTYDSRNFLVGQTDPLGHETTYMYDGVGNQIAVTDPNGHTTQYFYDKLNRLVKTKDPLGFETTYTYDCNGNTLSVTDANGNTTSYAYDALNRQISMTDALSFTTYFEYDKNNNLTKITDAKGNPTAYEYDALNRKTKETFADNTTKVFTYDGAGNVVSRKDNAGNMTYYTYDALNRLTLRDYPDANDDHFSYDVLGRMTEATNQNAVVTFTYDALNRMLSETLNGKTTGYAYNNTTGKRTLIYPSGRVIEEYYDARNQLASIKESNETLAAFAYDPAGRMTTRTYGNGTVTTYTYDANNRVTSILANPDSFIYFRYAYDNVGNKRYEEKLHHPTHSEAYGYDAKYQLTSFKVGTLSGNDVPAPLTQTVYNYDALGNRTTVVKDGVTTTYVVNEMNEYVMVDNGQSNLFQFDNNGNIIEHNGDSLSFDFENRLIEFNNYFLQRFDALGRRIMKQTNHNVLFYFSGNNVIEGESNGLFNTINLIYHPKLINEALIYCEEINDFYMFQNSNNSIIASVNDQNNQIQRYLYDDFGEPSFFDQNFNIIAYNQAKSFHYFASQEYDGEIYQYFMKNRHYLFNIGRFLQRDPLQYIDGFNQYTYVTNNPINFVDPFGNQSVRPSCKNCCEEIKAKHQDNGDVGGVVCCDQTPIPCVWISGGATGATNNTAKKIIDDCSLTHEKEHTKYSKRCLTFPFKGNVGRLPEEPSECQAYFAELVCLNRSLFPNNGQAGRCNGNHECEKQVKKERDEILNRLKEHCGMH